MARFSTMNLSALVLLILSCIAAVVAIPTAAAPEKFEFKLERRNETELADTGDSSHNWKLDKRFDGGRFTYYEVGLGACGHVNYDYEWVVALNSAQWDGGSHCDHQLSIYYGSHSNVIAGIVDECPGCPYAGLDLSPSLFSYLAGSTDPGVIYGSWFFI